jgi:hypothetical protein
VIQYAFQAQSSRSWRILPGSACLEHDYVYDALDEWLPDIVGRQPKLIEVQSPAPPLC